MSKYSSAGPTYNLTRIKELIRKGDFEVTLVALQHALDEGFTKTEMYDIVLKITEQQFHKTMPATSATQEGSGLFQDVYHYLDGSNDLYIKVQIFAREGVQKARVIQFKPWL